MLNRDPVDSARQFVGLVRTHLGTLLARKPQLVPKLVVNYARMNVLHQEVLRTASVNVESGCNAACNHCSADHMMEETSAKADKLTLEEYARALDGFLRMGAVSINLTGGEPMLNPDVYDIIRMVPPWRGAVNIQTNGIALAEPEVTKKLADAGCYIVMISLHSHRKEVHDELLNVPGAFDKVMRAIDNCRTDGMPVILNCTLTHEKVKDGTMWEMVRLAKEKGVTVNFVQPCTTGKWETNKDVRLSDEDYVEFDKAMKLPWVVWEGKSNYKENGCRPGLERMYMSASGDVIPCAFIHLNFGNVRKESVATIWQRMRSFEYFQQTHARCIASTDEKFYTEYIEPIVHHDDALYPIEQPPTYRKNQPDAASAVVR
jgi:MoaA/NifB/PqqE/SkfB family radical SAM enzyme